MCPRDATSPDGSNSHQANSSSSPRRSLFAALLAISVIAIGGTAFSLRNRDREPAFVLHTIDRGDLVVQTEFTATLSSGNTAEILCDVSAARPIDGRMSSAAELLWIIPNGELVEEGDLLVEFDAALIKDLRDDWQLKVVKSQGLLKQATLRCENERSKRGTDLANATTQLELLLTQKNTLDDIHTLQLKELLAFIKEAHQAVKLAEMHREFVEAAARLAQPVQDTPEKANLKFLTENQDLAKFLNEFKKLSRYDQPAKSEEIEAAVAQARRFMVQSQQNYEAEIEQLQAEQAAIQKALETEQERLTFYNAQLASCLVRAPFGGVVEHMPPEQDADSIVAGTIMRERQKILTLYDLTQPELHATVDAPAAMQLRTDMAASIRFTLDGGTPCSGTVTQVRQLGTSAEVVVTLDETPRLRPGTLANVNIVLEDRRDVIRIPVAALTESNDQSYCYVSTQEGLEQRPIQLGAIGSTFAEVQSGLQVGEAVINDATTVDMAPANAK